MIESTNNLLTDFWSGIPSGQEKPEYFSQSLEWQGREAWPEGLETQIEVRHGEWQWGDNWDCVDIPDTEYTAVMVWRKPRHYSEVTRIPGLHEEQNIYYPWQQGMVEVNGIYFFNKHTRVLQSIEDLTSQISQHPVRIFLYGEEGAKESPAIEKLEDEKGELYHAVFVHPIRKIEDILGLFHELGHVIVDSENGDKFEQENDEVEPLYERDANAKNKEVRDLGGESVSEEDWARIKNKFFRSEGFQKAADLNMREEVDAWSGALYLLNKVGITKAFEKGNEKLSDYMLHCIKTRIPDGIH